jgi:predicted DNA-binding transcriptional regulator AlpA
MPNQMSNNRAVLPYSSHILTERLEGTMPNQNQETNLYQSHVIYLKRQELESRYQVTKTTIYSWIKTRDLPAPIHFGANLVRWNSTQIDAWEVEKGAM